MHMVVARPLGQLKGQRTLGGNVEAENIFF